MPEPDIEYHSGRPRAEAEEVHLPATADIDPLMGTGIVTLIGRGDIGQGNYLRDREQSEFGHIRAGSRFGSGEHSIPVAR